MKESIFLFKHPALVAGIMLISLFSNFSMVFAQGDTWTTKAPMSTAKGDLMSCELDGKIYVMGGWTTDSYPNAVKTVEIFDPQANTWTASPELPIPIFAGSACAVNGKIYIMGGLSHDSPPGLPNVFEFDPATQLWTEKSPLPTARFSFGTCEVDGKIYAIGGNGQGMGGTQAVEVYDPLIDSWIARTPLPEPRTVSGVVAVNGKIYVIGGEVVLNAGIPLKTVWEYDPAMDTWTRKKDMPTARKNCFACAVNDMIYVIGGGVSMSPGLTTNEEYDPETDSWTTRADIPTPRLWFTASAVNNKIYAIGGQPAELFILTSSIEEYEPPQKGSIAVRQVSDSRLPEDFILEQNYPNPFNPSTTIKYALPQSLVVRLSVYDLLGREVSAIVNERRDAGVHEVKFDGSNFVSGVYFYRLQAGTYTKTKKLTVLK